MTIERYIRIIAGLFILASLALEDYTNLLFRTKLPAGVASDFPENRFGLKIYR